MFNISYKLRENRLYIGNLPFHATPETICGWLDHIFGIRYLHEREHYYTEINMPRKAAKRSHEHLYYVFVTFTTNDYKQQVRDFLLMNRGHFGCRALSVGEPSLGSIPMEDRIRGTFCMIFSFKHNHPTLRVTEQYVHDELFKHSFPPEVMQHYQDMMIKTDIGKWSRDVISPVRICNHGYGFVWFSKDVGYLQARQQDFTVDDCHLTLSIHVSRTTEKQLHSAPEKPWWYDTVQELQAGSSSPATPPADDACWLNDMQM